MDFGDDGSADFSFERAKIASIVVKARAGDDLVRIDESNGAFTDSIPTSSSVKPETTTSPEDPGPRRCSAATGTTHSTGTGVTTWR